MLKIEDKTAYAWIGCISAGVLGFLYWLLYVHVPAGGAVPGWVGSLPALNAVLNASSAVCLLTGFFFIMRGKRDAHLRSMLLALAVTILFLASYISYHHFMGSTHFGGIGWIRPLYYFILVTHVLLSAVVLPLAMIVLFFALTGRFDRHKQFSRRTFYLWLYVSVSGVAVYFMLVPYR